LDAESGVAEQAGCRHFQVQDQQGQRDGDDLIGQREQPLGAGRAVILRRRLIAAPGEAWFGGHRGPSSQSGGRTTRAGLPPASGQPPSSDTRVHGSRVAAWHGSIPAVPTCSIAGPRANPVACCFPRACPLLSRLLFVGAWGGPGRVRMEHSVSRCPPLVAGTSGGRYPRCAALSSDLASRALGRAGEREMRAGSRTLARVMRGRLGREQGGDHRVGDEGGIAFGGPAPVEDEQLVEFG